jgi:hypothetical protein
VLAAPEPYCINLLVVDVHRHFEAEADVAVSRSIPTHDYSPQNGFSEGKEAKCASPKFMPQGHLTDTCEHKEWYAKHVPELNRV